MADLNMVILVDGLMDDGLEAPQLKFVTRLGVRDRKEEDSRRIRL